jgi:deoxyribonuclease V
VGLLADKPAIGCAKSRLTGTHDEPAWKRGSRAGLIDKGERIGSVLRTQDGVNPVYVSIGHRMDLATAEGVVLACATRFRLPEPTRLADHVVARARCAAC